MTLAVIFVIVIACRRRTFEGMSESPGHRSDGLLRHLGRALRELEDTDDAAEADRAWEEPGEPVPLEDLEAEFGRK
jgi:hypothetical protein